MSSRDVRTTCFNHGRLGAGNSGSLRGRTVRSSVDERSLQYVPRPRFEWSGCGGCTGDSASQPDIVSQRLSEATRGAADDRGARPLGLPFLRRADYERAAVARSRFPDQGRAYIDGRETDDGVQRKHLLADPKAVLPAVLYLEYGAVPSASPRSPGYNPRPARG